MKKLLMACTALPLLLLAPAYADDPQPADKTSQAQPTGPTTEALDKYFKAEQKTSTGTVTVNGQSISYQAVTGVLVVHQKGFDDRLKLSTEDKDDKNKQPEPNSAEAAMSFVAYFKTGVPAAGRPITFIYNGGPGSATVWLHMGAFGPKRVVTADDSHTPAAPYQLINNDSSLLDVSDLVFIDAPGTGFGRIAGPEKEKAFWGVDADGHAFAEFIAQFLGKYGRWNSPKYLFGESYGTTRSAVLANLLENDMDIDLNGVILLSQILNFSLSVDGPEGNPGIDMPYQTALPTYAATAWYHKKLPGTPPDLATLMQQVEAFTMGDYSQALQAGASLSDAKRKEIAQKLNQFTGLPVDYILKADLRITGGEFEKMLQDDTNTTTGRLDTRFSGPTIDPLSKEADYDPQSSAISSAYVSAFNDYVRTTLNFGQNMTYRPSAEAWPYWDFDHTPPGSPYPSHGTTNVMIDLADAMKQNPNLKVMLNAGYFDLATPFFEGVFEMKHLPIPNALQANIEYKFYESGHMVYAHTESLKQLHDNVADFINRTSNLSGQPTNQPAPSTPQ